ncbi:hypothetical protein MTR67_001716 [Solanum verrucosum]|uniref:Pectinesterase catalytic domain-containing protein n=1 Tax=Solanum verrucosum TaxID=315347 RepID=A0AAF0T7Q7_SOLVR|nr:hypothetical protein MTR67_001716 [Solanum verrucosum]
MIVSKDGTENFNTIIGAILAGPDHSVNPFFIKIKKGTYQEYITFDKKKTNIFLIGEGMDTTIITVTEVLLMATEPMTPQPS